MAPEVFSLFAEMTVPAELDADAAVFGKVEEGVIWLLDDEGEVADAVLAMLEDAGEDDMLEELLEAEELLAEDELPRFEEAVDDAGADDDGTLLVALEVAAEEGPVDVEAAADEADVAGPG